MRSSKFMKHFEFAVLFPNQEYKENFSFGNWCNSAFNEYREFMFIDTLTGEVIYEGNMIRDNVYQEIKAFLAGMAHISKESIQINYTARFKDKTIILKRKLIENK